MSTTDIQYQVKKAIDDVGATVAMFEKKFKNKLEDCADRIRDLETKTSRQRVMGGLSQEYVSHEDKSDIAAYIRGETKGMSSGSGVDGGWTVNPVLENSIGTIVRNGSALRELITLTPLDSGDSYEELISVTPVGAKWVGETESRPETPSPKLVKITTILHEQYAEPVISQRLVDDSDQAMVDFLTKECGTSFTEAEELALFYGSGVLQPMGLNSYPTNALSDPVREFGTIQHIPTGAAGDFGSTAPFDAINDIFYKLKAGYRKNAQWCCNSETALALSKIKDGDGNYLWSQGNTKDGTPTTLLGKPVVICETAPGIAADAKALWFGDWNSAFRGIERPGYKLLLDPFTNKPNIVVYVYRRMGLQLRDSNALKCLKFSLN